jgi:hypothetical protein
MQPSIQIDDYGLKTSLFCKALDKNILGRKRRDRGCEKHLLIFNDEMILELMITDKK